MICPYCAEEIQDAAIVCRHCARDLTFFRPVHAALRAQEADVAALRAEVEVLRAALADLTEDVRQDEAKAVEVLARLRWRRRRDATGVREAPLWRVAALGFVVPFLGLLLAHDLIVLVFDWPVGVLRFASIAIPLVSAAALPGLRRLGVGGNIALALGLGVLAVLAMAGIVALHDHVAVLPETRRDWREAIEYSVSIALGFLAGVLVAHALAADDEVQRAGGLRARVRKVFPQAAAVARVTEVAMPLITTLLALYAGFKSLF